MEEGSKTKKRLPRALAACVCIFLIITIITSISLSLRFSMTGLHFLSRNQGGFCCPELLQQLQYASNLSIDPCHDFYGYSCHNWDLHERSSAFDRLVLENVTTPAYTGLNLTPAGKALSSFYDTCLKVFEGRYLGVQRAAAALVDALKPPLNPTPMQMVELVIRVHRHYGMNPGLKIFVFSTSVTLRMETSESGWTASKNLRNRQLGAEAFNLMMNTDVKWEDVKKKGTFVFTRDKCACCVSSTKSVLTDIFPNTTLQELELLSKKYYGSGIPDRVRHCSLSELKDFSRAVTYGAQPITLAAVVVEASIAAWESMYELYEEADINDICKLKTENQGILWDKVVADAFGDPTKDDIVRRVYQAIVDETARYAASVFPPDDSRIADKIIRNSSVFVSSDLHLADVAVPTMPRFDYWRKTLALNDYSRGVRWHQIAHGIPWYKFGLFKQKPLVQGNRNGIIVPPSIYPAIKITAESEPTVNMPVIAPEIARGLRLLLVKNSDLYSKRMLYILKDFETCRSEHDDPADERLHIETVVNVARNSAWNEVVDFWRGKNVTRSQVFYMNFAFTHYCSSIQRRRGMPARVVLNKILHGIQDFSKVFGCPALPKDTFPCSLQASAKVHG